MEASTIRDEFNEILEDAARELDIPEGEIDRDEALNVMSSSLNQLMSKLSETEKREKEAINMKSEHSESSSSSELSLKRDNKRSVKKDLSRLTEEELENIDEVDEMLEAAETALKDAETEVAKLESELESKNADLDNIKVSVTNMSPKDIQADAETEKVVKKLEDTLKHKLSKLGLDTGGRPIEVKLITTQIPDSLGDVGESSEEDARVQGMFFNIMTGNIQAYEDINNQRTFEHNYKFSFDEDIDKKLKSLKDSPSIQEVLSSDEEVTAESSDFLQFGEERERPSSKYSKVNNVEDVDDTNKHTSDEDQNVIEFREEL